MDQKKTTVTPDLDDTDMFFLSMSRMTKKLPQIDQARIKLDLSNSVLQAELKNSTAQENIYSPRSSLPSGTSSRISYANSPLLSPNEVDQQSNLSFTEHQPPMRYNNREDFSPIQTDQYITHSDFNEEQESQKANTSYGRQPRPTLLELTSLNNQI